ncbi:MAG: hypothetical protein M3209_09695 [Acidobacteriota bacterium]|nr:hypothetical protein [Acidobacteriota bacterium]
MAIMETVSLKTADGRTIFDGTADEFQEAVNAIRQAAPKELYQKLGLEGHPDDPFDVPADDEFPGSDFLSADEDLRDMYEALRGHFPDEFWFLEPAKVMLFWKAKGGSGGGNDTLGKCQKPSGLLRHYSTADFIIWLAADHLRERKFTRWQVLALVYHEMRHTNCDGNGKFVLRGHEFEGFVDEIERFGAWKTNAESIIKASQKLPGFD